MITVDTNVLARAILNDDDVLTPLTQALLKELGAGKGIFISSFSLLELSWILRGKKKSKIEIFEILRALVETSGITIGNHTLVATALELFKKAKIGFEDCLILAESLTSGAASLKTFDKDFAASHQHCDLL